MKAKACDVACAPPPAAVFLGGAQVRQLPDSTLRVSRMGGGSPKTPRAEQRRRWSYPSLERILIALGRSLGSLVIVGFGRSSCFKNWACYRHVFNLRRHHRGKLCYGSVGMGAAVAFAATRWGSRFIASIVAVDKAQNSRRAAHVELDQLKFNSIWFNLLKKINSFGTSSWNSVNRNKSNFPLPPTNKCLLGDSFFEQLKANSIRLIKKQIDSIFTFSS